MSTLGTIGTAILSSPKRQKIVLAGVAIVIYMITLGHGFVLDDSIAIQQNPLVAQGFQGIGELLTTPYQYGYTASANVVANPLYRPLSLILFAIEHGIAGDNPFLGHFVNLLLFAGCVVLLFHFINRLFPDDTIIAFIAGLLFAVHPIHTEAVANIKSCDELLCFFFSFMALSRMLSYAQNNSYRQLILACAFYFLALLSKETAITLLAVIPLIFFFYANGQRRRSIILTAAALIVAGLWLAIRSSVFASHEINGYRISFLDNSLVAAPSAASRFATAFLILGHYLRLLFIPYPLYSDYSYNEVPYASFGNVAVILSALAYVLLVAVGVFRLIKKPKDIPALGIWLFLITIAMFSNILFLIGSDMAERFLFMPSAGFCIAVAFVLAKWRMLKDKLWVILAPIALIFAILTVIRSAEWKSNVTLLRADAHKSSRSWRIYYQYGLALFQDFIDRHPDEAPPQELVDEGLKAFQKAADIYPDYDLIQARLATAFSAANMYDSAEVHFKKAAMLNPESADNLRNLSMLYFSKNEYRKALDAYRSILAQKPKAPAQGFIGICYMQLGKFDSAAVALRTGYQQQHDAEILKNLVYAFSQLGNKDSAQKYQAMMK